MKSKANTIQVSLVIAIIIGIIGLAFTVVTLGILAGGWLVNWMFPTISYEFASLIAGQGVLTVFLLLAITAFIAARAFAQHEYEVRNREYDDDDEDSDEDADNAEAAEWLAERIADITHAKLTQTAPKSRRYTAKPRGK